MIQAKSVVECIFTGIFNWTVLSGMGILTLHFFSKMVFVTFFLHFQYPLQFHLKPDERFKILGIKH